MNIQIKPPSDTIVTIQFEAKELVELSNSLEKLNTFVEENGNLGFRDKRRLNKKEKENIHNFMDALDEVKTSYLNIE